jgi:hypothetical protein
VLAQQYSPPQPQRRTIVFESDDAQPAVMSADLPAGIYLLDVREDDEWAAGHAPDAIHVRLSELSARTEEIPRDREVFVICRSGVADGQRVRRHDWLGRRRPPDDQRDWRRALRGVTPSRSLRRALRSLH